MLDKQVIALAKAIRQHETGNRQIAGATGELASRYQFLPSTWATEAKRILGDSKAELTLENENKVAYTRMKEWKDKGYNPGQIASMWNSGNPDMYAKGTKGVGQSSANPDIQYNVPKYVDSVYKLYEGFKPKEKTQYQEDLVSGVEEERDFFEPSPDGVRYRDVLREGAGIAGSVINYFKEKIVGAGEEQKELMKREDEGEINKLAEFVGSAGVGAKTVVDVAFDTVLQGIKGISLLSEKISGTEGTGEVVKDKAINATIDFFNTESGKSVLEIVETGEQAWNKFEQDNPSLAEIVKGSARIAEALPALKGSKELAKPIIKIGEETAAVAGEALEATGKKILKGVEKQVIKEVEHIVSPKLTKKVKDLALKQNRITKKGVYELSKFEKEIAEVAAPYVRKSFTPQKNINNIMTEIGRESNELAGVLQKNDAIFNASQLKTKIVKGLEGVDDIMIDEKRLSKVKAEIVDLLINEVETKKLSSLWESRKKFDKVVESKLNAFAGVSTVKKDVVMAVRKAVNEFIVEKSPQLLKEGEHPFSESMAKMRKLYLAEQNIADKVLVSSLNKSTLGALGSKLSSISHKMGAIKGGAAIIGIYSLGQALFNPAVIGAILAYGSYKVGKTVITSKMLRKAIGVTLEKAGKLLNPQEKRYLRTLATELDKSIKSEEGFARLPGGKDKLTKESRGQTYLNTDEISDIQIEANRRLDKDGNVRLKKDKVSTLEQEAKKFKSADELKKVKKISTDDMKFHREDNELGGRIYAVYTQSKPRTYLGSLEVDEIGGKLKFENLDTEKAFQRKGVMTELINYVKKDLEVDDIEFGLATDEGFNFIKSLKTR